MSNELEAASQGSVPQPTGFGGLLRLPLRLAATSVAVGTRVTRTVTAQAVAVGREVLDGAVQGRPPEELADVVINGVSSTAREAVNAVSGVTDLPLPPVPPPGGADPAADGAPAAGQSVRPPTVTKTVTGQAQDLARTVTGLARPVTKPVTDRIPGSVGSAVGGAMTVQDVRKELRRQGRELLRRSTALDDPEEHPAFRSIIRQMAPDEARIVRLLATKGPQPVVDVIEYHGMTRSSREVSRHVSMIGREAGCLRPELCAAYLDNLARLGLVHIRDFQVGGQEAYDLLYAQPEVNDLPKPSGLMSKLKIVHMAAELSMFGQQLYEMCFADADPVAVTAGEKK